MSACHLGGRAVVIGALLSILAWHCLPAQGARAEDIVYLRTSDGRSTRLAGEIVDYSGRELKLRSVAGSERTIPAAAVQRIETTHCAEQTAGDEAFSRGDFRQALTSYRSALAATREPRDWVRRQILVQAIWCQRNLDEWDQAGEYFLILLESDPATRQFDCIPLVWTDQRRSLAVERKAQTWLHDEKRPAAVLLGASHLLATPERPEAIAALKRLQKDPDPRIAWLAEAQLWRTQSTAQARPWSEFARKIEAADGSLRAGAYYLLGSALASAQPEDGALALLRLPLAYPREYQLSAAALLQAGSCLERVGRTSQAAGLYAELLTRFGQTSESREAQSRLDGLAPSKPVGDN